MTARSSSWSVNPADWFDNGSSGGGSRQTSTPSIPGSGSSPFSWEALIPSAFGLFGDIYSAERLSQGQESANRTALQSAREQMAFQERMSSTAHTREVADLRSAGLNPVLSANSGASTPVGSAVEPKNAAPDYTGVVRNAVQTALQMRMANAQLKNLRAQQENIDADTKNKKQQYNINTPEEKTSGWLSDLFDWTRQKFNSGKQIFNEERHKVRKEKKKGKGEAGPYKWDGKFEKYKPVDRPGME